MKITSVSARVLAAKPERAVEFAIGTFDVFSCVLVEIRAEDGTVGYGEAMTRRGPHMTKAAVESLLAPVLIGKDLFNIEGLWLECMNRLRRWGHSRGVVMEAISGVDIALWDLAGKLLQKPVWQLLYGVGRKDIPCYASSVYIKDREQMCREAAEQVARGFRAVKIKIGRSRELSVVHEDIRNVQAIRETVGPDVDLMVDANGAYDAATAIRVSRALEATEISWFEEPVPPDDLDGYARIHAMTSVPLATGETEFSVFGFRELFGRGLIDVAQPDTARSGGITGARHTALLAFAHNKAFAPHTGFSGGLSQLSALHVAAAAPVLTTFEYMFIDNPLRNIFEGGFPEAVNGFVRVPEKPGLGLELDWPKIERFTAPDAVD